MTRYVVTVPHPVTGEPWEIHQCDTMAEAIYVSTVLGTMGCPIVAILERSIDVDATIAQMESMLSE